MVRKKNLPEKLSEPISTVNNTVGDAIVHCAEIQHRNMVVDKCHACQLAMNRAGEGRPGIRCKDCKDEHCNKCAGLTVVQCQMMRDMKKGFWSCSKCESQSADMKAVLESVTSIKSELADQQGEREQVLESLKAVEVVVKRLERIEDVQDKQEQQLVRHEDTIKKNTKKGLEGEKRIKQLEDQVVKISQDKSTTHSSETDTIRQTNAVVREIREIEKCERNLMFGNVPEPTSEDGRKEDENRVSDILREIKMEHIKPTDVKRVGRKSHFSRKIQVVFRTIGDAEQIREAGLTAQLPNGVYIARDRTYNQRYEARLYRLEKEKEEKEAATGGAASAGVAATSGKPRGRPRGSFSARGLGPERGGTTRGGGARGGGM